jgi:hypothetical protein
VQVWAELEHFPTVWPLHSADPDPVPSAIRTTADIMLAVAVTSADLLTSFLSFFILVSTLAGMF